MTAADAVSAGSRYVRWRASSATITVSRTVNPLKLRAFWNARPIPRRARRYDAMLSTRRPNTSISPDDFTKPEIAFMSVVLPAPLVPIRPTTSPGRTSIETPATAARPPKRTCTSRVTSGNDVVSPATGSALTRDDKLVMPSVPRRCDGFQSVRRAMNARSWSRMVSTTEIKPPGTYSSRMSMPTPLANSCSCGLPSKTVGIPTTTIVPITAPVTDVRPPTTETASTFSDCCGREVVGNARRVPRREQTSGEGGDAT